MNIYIMRHGQAQMMAASDAERPLTAVGKEQSKNMAGYLADKKVEFDAAIVSPYVRARQTFAVVSSFFSKISHIQSLDSLIPSGSASVTIKEILALQVKGVKSLLIISHLPLVGYMVNELDPAAGSPSFSTSAVAYVELDDQGVGKLLSLTVPSNLN
ncbi:MAG: phosphohistidine phosphatase SixA [Psychromonas sp.]|nr:phosphohistidine phosphatase SixA [Psychromonas sp.]